MKDKDNVMKDKFCKVRLILALSLGERSDSSKREERRDAKKDECGLMGAASQATASATNYLSCLQPFLWFISSLFIRDWKLTNLESSQQLYFSSYSGMKVPEVLGKGAQNINYLCFKC